MSKKKKKKKPAPPIKTEKPVIEDGPLAHSPFAALKEFRIEEPPPPPPEPPPKVKEEEPPDESELFEAAMAGVAPPQWKHMRVEASSPPTSDGLLERELYSEDMEVLDKLRRLVDGEGRFDIVDTDEYLEGFVKGIRPVILQKLRKGKFSVQAYLDLHGLTLKEAKEEVAFFVQEAVSLRYRCVLLVHGRGLNSKDQIPVLKKKLSNILLTRPVKQHILAFTTARPVDGGAGASYVLLRAKRK